MRLFLLTIFLLSATATEAANQAREQSMATGLIERIGSDEVLWLKSDGGDFLALESQFSSGKKQGGVILLHDIDGHPDWPEVVSPLRKGLPKKGWPTLSVQLPLLSNEAGFSAKNQQKIIDQAHLRIIAAVERFTSVGIYNIALIGHGLGATAISHFLSGNLRQSHAIYIKAFVAIRFRTHDQLPKAYRPQALLKLKTPLPILDILGTQEPVMAQQQAKQRKSVATQAQNPNYRQELLSNANNNFWGAEGLLVSRISSWLKVNAAGAEVELEKLPPPN